MGVQSYNVVAIPIKKSLMPLARMNAKKSTIHGISRIREGGSRGLTVSEDALVGQLGALAGCIWMTGNPMAYMTARWYANRTPNVGDGGSDLPASNVDFKTSLMRKSKNPMDYHLLVRPHERHSDSVYVHILLDNVLENVRAFITGWATDEMLPSVTVADGPLKGAYRIAVPQLNPVPPFQWLWNDEKKVAKA